MLTQSFNGAGDTVTPTLINILCLWLGEIPLAYVLARPVGFGPAGVFWSIAIAFSVMSLVSAAVFRRGRWKTETRLAAPGRSRSAVTRTRDRRALTQYCL